MLLSKKIYQERDFVADVYLSESRNPIPPAPLAQCMGGRGELNQRVG